MLFSQLLQSNEPLQSFRHCYSMKRFYWLQEELIQCYILIIHCALQAYVTLIPGYNELRGI